MSEQQFNPFKRLLFERYGGLIQAGPHEEHEGAACALELASLARGRGLSDKSADAGLPTLWPISDGLGIWSDDKSRTDHVLPMIEALWGWPEWSNSQQKTWKGRVVQRTIQEMLPCLLRTIGLEAEAEHCAQDGNLEAALAAREAAKEVVECAKNEQDAILWLNAVHVREAATFVVRAVSTRDDFELAYAAYNVASALHCIANGRSSTALETATDTAYSRSRGASAVEILSLACHIWREEAEQVLKLKSH